MSSTHIYREQHQELLELMERLAGLLDQDGLVTDASAAFGLLGTLASKLDDHVTAEDAAFYPALIHHADPKVATVARKFHEEVGWLKTLASIYFNRWSSPGSIQQDPDAFGSETKVIARFLTRRIQVEHEVLFDLADSLEPSPASEG